VRADVQEVLDRQVQAPLDGAAGDALLGEGQRARLLGEHIPELEQYRP
jgi:hypothetical protein